MITAQATLQSKHMRLPPEQFYWARLETTQLGESRRPNLRSLGYLFESVLPIPIEDVHAVYERIDANTFLACAMSCTELSELNFAGAITLTPSAVPTFLECNVEASRLNLLTVQFAPPQARRLKTQCLAIAIVLVVGIAVLLIFGMERRINAMQAQAVLYDERENTVARSILGDDASANSLPVRLQLTALARELRSTRDVQTGPIESSDAAVALSELLTVWPRNVSIQTTSLSVTPQMITIQGSLDNAGNVQQLADALQILSAWDLRQPRVNSSRDSVRTTIQLVRRTGAIAEVTP